MSNTARIAKNTVVLYVRMVITMIIALYSSRIVLEAIGIDDFGLYNAVCGVVGLLTFLRSSLTSATQRFLSYEMGLHDNGNIAKVFSVSLTTHFLIAIIVFVLAETIGLWFLNTHISIPIDRIQAANWIYQFSVFTLVVSLITVPYSADIISHERMTFYAFVSIIEALLKLLFAVLLLNSSYDRLIMYGAFMMLITIICFCLYWGYCRIQFKETKYYFIFEKDLFYKIFSFSGWTLLGQFAVVGANQGMSILVNIFHPLSVNAAMGVAQQINGAITGLTANFQTAFQPQITKSYAEHDYNYLNVLINYASKISFFLLFIVSIPVVINIDWILDLWLKEVPSYSNVFCICFIISSIANALSSPLWIAIFATGKVKMYQIIVSIVYLLDIIIVFGLFNYGMSPITAGVMKIITNAIIVIVRIYFSNKEISCFSINNYLKGVVIPCILSAILTIIISLLLVYISYSTFTYIISQFIIIVISIVSAYYVGLNKLERIKLNNVSRNFLNKINILRK